ncbi:hypothetical protein HYPSUDRAFT_41233 [Hypholoma sublateritium FD-334 SS-4]|uniref:Uncharacterized protein n=1 Tax=Hypholoma sublateritium (strain FD-334 SS-4) TaxID=945553 RepID=A0A0D2MES9_HYPSF|nr:hypothetical protein HYPSUDRAFT_41233 [Hypholoma sublateritium FD-334 SS-4]
MCNHKVIGDFYRGCGHFHGRYFTGEYVDCLSQICKTSSVHKHKSATNCGCDEVVTEDRKIQNMFQIPFPECKKTSR